MDSKHPKPDLNTTLPHPPPSDVPPSYPAHHTTKSQTPSPRPGADLMQSGDPSTAALRAWANDKELHVPGSDGSFITGPMSMGVGAVSGGPLFLPRKEYIVEPPVHEVDRLQAERLKEEEVAAGRKERRGSFKEFLGRLGGKRGKEEAEGVGK